MSEGEATVLMSLGFGIIAMMLIAYCALVVIAFRFVKNTWKKIKKDEE